MKHVFISVEEHLDIGTHLSPNMCGCQEHSYPWLCSKAHSSWVGFIASSYTSAAQIFEIPAAEYRAVRARFVPDAVPDPYAVLGVDPATPLPEIRRAWSQIVRESHPDRLVARGLPEEAVMMAEKRLIDVNNAWEEIQAMAA